MATKDIVNDYQQTKVITNALDGEGGGGSDANPITQQLNQLMLLRLQREERERQDVIDTMEKVRQQTKAGVEQQEAEKRKEQANCTHRKENGMTRLGGQKAQDGYLYLHCTMCCQEYSNNPSHHNPWPASLQPRMEVIGGPSM